MKTQSWMLLTALALVGGSSFAQDKKASQESVEAAITQRAEALTEEQISQSHDVAGLGKLAQIYEAKGDMQRMTWVLRRVSELMPNSGNLKMQLALAYAKQGDKSRTYDTLMRMQVAGFGYDISNDARFDPVHGTAAWDYIVKNLQVNTKQFGEGAVAFELPNGDALLNAVAWDPKRKKLLVGSARDGSIKLVDETGKASDFIAPGADGNLWGVDAMAVDAARGKLYVTTSSPLRYKGFSAENANKAAVVAFDLATGKFVQKYTLPREAGPRTFNSIVAAKDGQVYVADGAHKTVLKIEGQELKPIVQNPKLTNISAITVSDDGRTLYLADYAMGIYGFDLAKGAAFELRYNPAQLVLGGIVGMNWYDGTLIIIEDGMIPKRVMRLKMSPDGQTVLAAMPLDAANPAFGSLGAGTLAGDKLYFVSNRQDELYDSHGVLVGGDRAEPELMFRSNARFAWNESGKQVQGTVPTGDTKDAAKAYKPADKPADKQDSGKH